jgi:uncharacterized repeat protein (TIGR03803 family)
MNSKKSLTLRVSALCFGIALGGLVILSLVGVANTVRAQDPATEKVVFNFRLTTGYYPTGVVRDPTGNLYVATIEGGSNQTCDGGCGDILKVSPSGQSTELYAFTGNGSPHPIALTRDAQGILYGVTSGGGHYGDGSVFKLTPSGKEGILHSFDYPGDGYAPSSGVTIDSEGNLYGVTEGGGLAACECGTIYKVTPSGDETVLYSFTGGSDGGQPDKSPVLLDAAGNLYGTASEGGDLSCSIGPGYGCGTVWKLDTSGNLIVLYSFTGGTDGAFPDAGLVMDSSGNLYGDTEGGGNFSCNVNFGCGVLFEIGSSGNFTVLHTFTGGSADGECPSATLFRDSAGNLYGTTALGGGETCGANDTPGCGVVFKVDTSGDESILHAFTGPPSDGALPVSALISDGKGNLYGTTPAGGAINSGVLFVVRAQ